MADLAAARSYLRGADSADAASAPVSVHAHLQSLLLKIVRDKPARPLQHFEALSIQIKQERFKKQQQQQQQQQNAAAAATAASSAAATPAAASVPSGGILGLDVAHAPLFSSAAQQSGVASYLQRVQDAIKKPKKFNEDGEEEEEEEVEMNPLSPDLQRESHMLQQAGVSLLESEWHTLSLSLQTLCDTTEGLENARFWGKIYGTKADYYIVEGKLADYPDDEEEEEAARQAKAADAKREPDEGEEEGDDDDAELPPVKTEPWGTGANEYVYWVCNATEFGSWTRLPKVTPEQIQAARGMRRFMTGDLKAAVFGFPRFPWGEASFLRAQIARITAGTALCPRGVFLGDDEEPLIALENEEFKGLRASALLSPDNWVHYRAKLLGEGRVEAFVDENAEEEPEDDELSEIQREERAMRNALKEKPVPILSPASNDRLLLKPKKLSSKKAAALGGAPQAAPRVSRRPLWKFQLSSHADLGLKPLPAPGPGIDVDDLPADAAGSSQVVASAHSLLWPGAVSLAQNKTHLSVYVGYGLKAPASSKSGLYKPAGPAPFCAEYSAPQVANRRGVIPQPLLEQADLLPPPRESRSAEELEEEDEEERQRLKRVAAEEGEPEEELEEDEEDDRKEDEDD